MRAKGTSPRPWRAVSASDRNDRWTIAPAGPASGEASLFVGGRVRNEADAALIVTAVNDYDRLRALDAAARAWAEDHPEDRCGPASAIRAALGVAEP